MTIKSDDTIRDVLKKYPDARKVFDKYGLMGCGGPQGPKEAISFFATVHKVDPEVLLEELNNLVHRDQ